MAPPRVLRGKTGIQHGDDEGIAALVAQALEWDVDPATVKVKDSSGAGGGKT